MVRTTLLLLCLALGVAVLGWVPSAALGQDGGDLERARQLVDEARPFNRSSGDPDLDHGQRKKARKEAYTRLKEARRLYDAYFDANPSEEEALDAEYVEANSMMYWLKKMAAINEFDDVRDNPVELPKPEGVDEPTTEPNGGITSHPKPPKPEPEPEPGTDPVPEEVEQPVARVESPEAVRARLARETFVAIQDIERENPGDVGRLHDLYVQFLAEYDDPSLPEYTKAAMRLGALSDRMKTVFKKEVGQDPDSIKNVDAKEVGVIVTRLAKQIKSKDLEERRSAAKLLGNLGTGAASFALVRALRDKDAEVAQFAADGLARLGGMRTCYNLVKTYRDANQESQMAALAVLSKIANGGEVDGRTASSAIGRFALSRDDAVAESAIDQLTSMGLAGGPGLVESLSTRQLPKKVRIIRAIGNIKYYPGAKPVAAYLLRGGGEKTVAQRAAAIEALKSMGMPIVGDLIDLLKSSKHKAWVNFVLRDITGQNFGMKYANRWRAWWNKNKPEGVE